MIPSSHSISSLLNDKGPYVELIPLIKDGNITFVHGSKTYVIKFIKQQIGTNKETDIDLSYFADTAKLSPSEQKQRGEELSALIQGATKAMNVMDGLEGRPEGLTGAHSFTLNFTQKYTQPSILSTVLGDYLRINRWKFKPEPIVLETISYKESATSEEKKFTVNLESYSGPVRAQIQNELSDLSMAINGIAKKSLENRKPHEFKPKQPEKPLISPDSEEKGLIKTDKKGKRESSGTSDSESELLKGE